METTELLALAQTRADRESLQKQRARLEELADEARRESMQLPPPENDADPLAPVLTHERHPFKVGVTALVRARKAHTPESPAMVDPEDGDPAEMETTRVKRLPLPLTRPRQIADLPRLPAFLREAGEGPQGIVRGVAAHKALCLLPYDTLRGLDRDALRQEIHRQLDSFTQKRLFTTAERDLLDADALAGFFASAWGQAALAAEIVHREWSFVLALPEEDGMLVQGVIDLCYVKDGAWELVDYKTDAVDTPEALWPLYDAQIGLYRRALVEITGLPVRSVTLYALALGAGASRTLA